MRRTGVPGLAVAVVHDDKVVYLKGYGVRKAGTNQRVDADTVFMLASVSKPLGASVIAAEIGRGTVRWTEPVSKYLPGFTLSDPYVGRTVTLADMYAHRSGLPDHAGDLLEDLGYDRATILQRLALEPLQPFRITYNYTNFGITAAAEAAARAANTSWEDLSERLLYRPLGMRSTSSRFADYEHSSNHALLHVLNHGKWLAKYTRQPDAESPAGGASSSARDMAQWLRMELGNGSYNGAQVVDRDALLATRTPNLVTGRIQPPDARASFYGLGVGVAYDAGGRLRLSHSGAFALGAATTILMLPSERLGIVVLTNAMPQGIPEALAQEFFDLAEFNDITRDWYAAYNGLMQSLYHNPSSLAGKARPANAAPPQDLQTYAGTYSSAYYGQATVEVRTGRLMMLLGPHREAFPLTHWSGNTFSYFPRGENALGIAAVTFAGDSASHSAQTMTVENLNDNGLGKFTRD